jgi:hypothetical protein
LSHLASFAELAAAAAAAADPAAADPAGGAGPGVGAGRTVLVAVMRGVRQMNHLLLRSPKKLPSMKGRSPLKKATTAYLGQAEER